MNKRVLVTGASGFVGANLVRHLLEAGHTVCAMVREEGFVPRLESIKDRIEVRVLGSGEWVKDWRPDRVFHLAAAGAYSWQTDSSAIVEANAAFTARLLDLTESAEFFLHSGSSSEYGYKDHPPSELELAEPNSVYAATKLCATNLCRVAGARLQRPTITTRLYSVYGPYEDARRLVPTVVRAGFSDQLPSLVDPEVARDFVHVDDVCKAFSSLADQPPADFGAIYNLGSGVQTTIREVAEIAIRVFDLQVEPNWGSMPNRGWDTRCWVADPTKIEREYGWRVSKDFGAGFRDTVDWYRLHPEWLDPSMFRQI